MATVLGLVLGAIWTPYALAAMAGLIAIITCITAFQRIGEVWDQAKEQRQVARKERAKEPQAGERSAP